VPAFLKVFRTATKPLRIVESASVELPRDAAAMFAFMHEPASSAELFDEVESGVRLPGTPVGIGEIQVFVRRGAAGRTASVLEVVEFEPGRRAVTRNLSDGSALGILTVEPLGAGSCRLTQEFRIDFPVGGLTVNVGLQRAALKDELHRMMARLTELAPRLED
jgi:hypothetical protein